jgi:hypothetical protein
MIQALRCDACTATVPAALIAVLLLLLLLAGHCDAAAFAEADYGGQTKRTCALTEPAV